MSQAVVVLSGGQDSTTCAFWAKQRFDKVTAVTINYGQRHAREIVAANEIANLAGLDGWERIDVSGVLKSTSPLTDQQADLGQYKDWQHLPGGLEKTFVPMRNMLFLTLAANRAIAQGCSALVTGVCQEDFGGYPDCRRVFINAMEDAIGKSMDMGFEIHTPLMDLSKAESVALALSLPGCYAALGFSHTAYDGAYPPLGHDHATLLRAKGFEQAGVPDPLIVRAYWEGLMPLPFTSPYAKYRQEIFLLRSSVPSLGAAPMLARLQKEFR